MTLIAVIVVLALGAVVVGMVDLGGDEHGPMVLVPLTTCCSSERCSLTLATFVAGLRHPRVA